MNNNISVLIAFICNPYLAVLQLKLFKKIWEREVDEILVGINGRNSIIRKFIADIWDKEEKVKLIDQVDSEIRQGPSFDRIYKQATGKILMTLDSDMIISKPGILTKYATKLLNNECSAVGSIGYPAFPGSVAKKAIQKYGTVRLNPFLSFWKKEIIDKIKDLTFGTYNYKEGDFFEPLGKMPGAGWMDVMSKLSLQYFHLSPKYFPIPASIPGDYFHIGAISSLYRRDFRGLEDRDTQSFDKGFVRDFKPYYLAWYYLIYDLTKDMIPFEKYNQEYERGFELELKAVNADLEGIRRLAKEYRKIHLYNLSST